ncbi:MAG: metallophosphoesterase [Armatimonadota bacterium]
MRRRIYMNALVILVLFVFTAIPSFAWRFVSFADSRGSDNGVNSAIFSKIITRINLENPDLVIFQGDAVDGSTSDTTFSSQFDYWKTFMAKLNSPWYFVPGNHEINTANAENILRNKLSMPTNGPSGYGETVYSFNYQNAHFVGLNSYSYGKAHHVQRSWLATDLANNTQPHVFVMAHDPAYPVGTHKGSSLDAFPTERDDFWNIMTNNRVGMYFCGHEHLYSRSKHGSIYQVINGSCGAPLTTGFSGTIAKYQYVVVDINGYNVSCTAKDENGIVIDSWSYSVPSTGLSNMSLTISADKSTALPADVITYTLRYSNTGAGPASNVQLRIPVPANTTYVSGSASTGGAYDSASNSVLWTVSSIAAGASGTCTARVKIN